MDYTSTTKSIYYINDTTSVVKIGVYAVFDEAHCTAPRAQHPLAAQALQTLGHSSFRDKFKNGVFQKKHKLKIHLVHHNSTTPTRTLDNAIGFDIHTCLTTSILPGEANDIPTGLKFSIPTNYYLKFIPTSTPPIPNFTLVPQIINNKYDSDVHICVKNTKERTVGIEHGTCIAQMIYRKAIIPTTSINVYATLHHPYK